MVKHILLLLDDDLHLKLKLWCVQHKKSIRGLLLELIAKTVSAEEAKTE